MDFAEECKKIVNENMDKKNKPWEINPEYGLSIYLLMTQDCNLNCSYCYQKNDFRRKDAIMTKEMVDEAMKFIANNVAEDNIKFNMFGGEPFLNFDVIKYAVETYPMMRFLITTNGIVLSEHPEICEWVNEHKQNLNISFSLGSFYTRHREGLMEKAKPVLDVVKHNGGDVHYVIEDPTDPRVEGNVRYLFEYGLQCIRLSQTRHVQNLINFQQQYIDLFKKLADFIYFGEKPYLRICNWDTALKNNIYKSKLGQPLASIPPTFCGAGSVYICINSKGEIFPCDAFSSFPEFKLGDIYEGFNNNSVFFKSMSDWKPDLYEDCKKCTIVKDGDIRLCPKAMCLAENYTVNKNMFKPAKIHCEGVKIDYELFNYIADGAIARGISYFTSESKGDAC